MVEGAARDGEAADGDGNVIVEAGVTVDGKIDGVRIGGIDGNGGSGGRGNRVVGTSCPC